MCGVTFKPLCLTQRDLKPLAPVKVHVHRPPRPVLMVARTSMVTGLPFMAPQYLARKIELRHCSLLVEDPEIVRPDLDNIAGVVLRSVIRPNDGSVIC